MYLFLANLGMSELILIFLVLISPVLLIGYIIRKDRARKKNQ